MPPKPSITHKAISGLAGLLIAIGFFLFIPAGSLDFAEAWVYLAIFGMSTVLITAYFLKKDPRLIESRIKSGPAAEKEHSQKVIQGITGTAFLFLMIIPGLDHRFGWSHIPLAGIVAGDLLLVFGFFIVFLTFRENTFTSAVIEIRTDQTVVSTGPYAIVRHPMYVGGDFVVVGTAFALGSYWALIPALCIAVGIIWRILGEEKYLAKNLPGYREYQMNTRYRLIPFVW